MRQLSIILLFISFSLSAFSQQDQAFRAELATLLLSRDLELSKPAIPQEITVTTENGEDFVQVRLKHYGSAGTVRLLLKGPQGFLQTTSRSLGSVLLVSGFFTGVQSVKLLGAFPGTVIAGFQYPISPDDLKRDPAAAAGKLLRETPGQIALALQWLARQSWADPKGVLAVGVSLGGLFLPSSLHLAQKISVSVPRAVFVCTGAHLTPILEAGLRPHMGEGISRPLVHAIANLTALHDPKLHLPMLRGHYLSIRTAQDEVIPESSGRLLEELLPKVDTVLLQGPHINPDQTEIINQTRLEILNWLSKTH